LSVFALADVHVLDLNRLLLAPWFNHQLAIGSRFKVQEKGLLECWEFLADNSLIYSQGFVICDQNKAPQQLCNVDCQTYVSSFDLPQLRNKHVNVWPIINFLVFKQFQEFPVASKNLNK
jgi:hypothetical protein